MEWIDGYKASITPHRPSHLANSSGLGDRNSEGAQCQRDVVRRQAARHCVSYLYEVMYELGMVGD